MPPNSTRIKTNYNGLQATVFSEPLLQVTPLSFSFAHSSPAILSCFLFLEYQRNTPTLGFCMCFALCPDQPSFIYVHGSHSHILQVFCKCLLLQETLPDHGTQITFPCPSTFFTLLTCSSFIVLIEF